MTDRICGRDACGKPHYARNLCRVHYDQLRWSSGLEPLEARTVRRRYTLDEAYFDEIDTPEKAYWLGFIAADGYVSDRGYLSVALAEKDLRHLEALAAAVGSDAPIKRSLNPLKGKLYPRGRVCFHSRRLVTGLAAQGIVPRKSLTLDPWSGPADLMRHYWRGVIDGDGTIGKRPEWGVQLVGTLAVVTAFRDWARGFIPAMQVEPHQRGNIWVVVLGGRIRCRTVVQVLYEDCSMALPRKAALAADLISTGPTIIGTPAYSAMLSARQLGRKFPNANHAANKTPEFREAARQRATGRAASLETRRKMSEAQRRVQADRSPEVKAAISRKISESRRGSGR